MSLLTDSSADVEVGVYPTGLVQRSVFHRELD